MVKALTADVNNLLKRHISKEGRNVQASHVLVLDVE